MFFTIPHTENENVFYFTGGDAATDDFIAWTQPPNIKFINMLVIGGGGGAVSGGNKGSTNVGSGGGGSGGVSVALYNAAFLPKTLFIKAGGKGLGVKANLSFPNATDGFNSLVSIEPTTNSNFYLCYANGGSASIYSGTSPGGAGATIASISSCPLITNAINYNFFAGASGTNGAISAAAASINATTTSPYIVTGGTGGGTYSYNAGNITTLGPVSQTLLGGQAGIVASLFGTSGIINYKTLWFTGGTGGAGQFAYSTVVGGGGDGAYGCGGGGGGFGINAAGSGKLFGLGGNGGPGLIVITCW